jgi:hypothetical protein
MLGFDLLAIIPSSFSQVFTILSISKKSSKIKFLEKIWKNLFKFLCQKWGREAPDRPQGDPPRHLTTRGFIPTSFSLSKNLNTPAQTRVLAALHRDFLSPCSAHLWC